MDGLQKLIEFAVYLRSQRMPFLIGQNSHDAITLSFGTFGNRFCLDFYEDRVGCRRYGGTEDLSEDLNPVHAMVEALAAASRPSARLGTVRGVVADGAGIRSGGMRRLLDFTASLRANGIHHAFEQHSPEAIEVSFVAQGKRVEVEFSVEGVLCSEFDAQAASVFDEDAIRREIEVFTRPYPPAMRMRKEREHAGR
jgi:hypothetical protein